MWPPSGLLTNQVNKCWLYVGIPTMFTISTSILYLADKYIKFKGWNNDRVFSEVCTYMRKFTSVVNNSLRLNILLRTSIFFRTGQDRTGQDRTGHRGVIQRTSGLRTSGVTIRFSRGTHHSSVSFFRISTKHYILLPSFLFPTITNNLLPHVKHSIWRTSHICTQSHINNVISFLWEKTYKNLNYRRVSFHQGTALSRSAVLWTFICILWIQCTKWTHNGEEWMHVVSLKALIQSPYYRSLAWRYFSQWSE
jgi:hypothetical protein